MPATDSSSSYHGKISAASAVLSDESPARLDAWSGHHSTVSRENFIRNAVKKWYGPNEALDTSARVAECSRQDGVLQALLRLHRVSCNLVPETRRLALQEQDVFTAIVVLNRIGLYLRSPLSSVAAYCEARSIREQNTRFNQLDPLQLRHLLTYHEDIPHEEMNALDLHGLRTACAADDRGGIQRWFETMGRRAGALPKDAPQYLRQLVAELWSEGCHEFMDTYARELAILDAGLLGALGWESSRLFFGVFKRLQGPRCRAVDGFVNAGELAGAIELHRQLGDADAVIHFRALSTAFDAQKLRRLETAILAAPSEEGSRIRGEAAASPLARKKKIVVPPTFATPEYYAQKHLRPVS